MLQSTLSFSTSTHQEFGFLCRLTQKTISKQQRCHGVNRSLCVASTLYSNLFAHSFITSSWNGQECGSSIRFLLIHRKKKINSFELLEDNTFCIALSKSLSAYASFFPQVNRTQGHLLSLCLHNTQTHGFLIFYCNTIVINVQLRGIEKKQRKKGRKNIVQPRHLKQLSSGFHTETGDEGG